MSQPGSPRQAYIAHQQSWLRPQAAGESDSGGRAHAEAEDPYRTCYQRDRDRIIHCSAFRRLDYKTQVFVPHQQDHFRTRLTHTLEVAQIGRDLARTLRVNEDLVEAVALAHDLGHAPFGHAGEAALNECMADHGGFEHNRQSLRVVDYLEHPYPAFRGLNLTRIVRECIAKHATPYDAPGEGEFDPDLQPPLAGQLIDACDQIAYTSADLEDALHAGWITVDQLAELDLWRMAATRAATAAPDARPIHKRIRATKAVLTILAEDVIAATTETLAATEAADPRAVRREKRKCVLFSPPIFEALRQLGDFLLHKVYRHPESRAQGDRARRCIGELFEQFTRQPQAMGERYANRAESEGVHRVACDFIAGMTDRYCRQRHKLLGPK